MLFKNGLYVERDTVVGRSSHYAAEKGSQGYCLQQEQELIQLSNVRSEK